MDMIYFIISYILMGISLTVLSKTSVYYAAAWTAWIPFANQFMYCRIIGDKQDLNLEKNLLISYGLAAGAFILHLLAAGSLLGNLLLICFAILLLAISIIMLTATYYLIRDTLPYAKSILIVCILCAVAGTYFKYLTLAEPVVILICSLIMLRRFKTDEALIAQRVKNEQKYREELERERYL